MTALDALVAVLDAGGSVVPDPENPKVTYPPNLRPLVAEHRPELRSLVLAYGHCHADVFRRARSFKRQIAEWTASNRPGVPLLVLPGSPAPQAGWCVSCGCGTADGWRCVVCLEAVHVALALAIEEA
jgi:hypothetical protein